MGNATAQVHLTVVDDDLEVVVPAELEPLDDFLETEIGTSETTLDLVEHHVRHARTWSFTGDACQLDLANATVTITHLHTGVSVELSRADLLGLLAELRVLL
jgi:hypothetical protein